MTSPTPDTTNPPPVSPPPNFSSDTVLIPVPAESQLEIEKLLALMTKYQASDLHLKIANQPVFRIASKLRPLDLAPLTPSDISFIINQLITPEQLGKLNEKGDLDFARSIPQVGRFRINIFRQRNSFSLAIRRVNSQIPDFTTLHLPEILSTIASYKQGLVIVSGATGSGKSTTLASMIEYINARRRTHIITIEDPIEYLYQDKKSLINQREVGIDVPSFEDALRTLVRQNPDIILIGELRDAISFATAITAAETGHLVFGTIHSASAPQTLSRIIDLFPPHQQENLRQTLQFVLKAIICQKLMPADKQGVERVPATEIMINTPIVGKLIREHQESKLPDVIRGGKHDGMHDFNQSLITLVHAGLITEKTALRYSPNSEQLKMNLQGIFLGDDNKIVG